MTKTHLALVTEGKAEYMGTDTGWKVDVVVVKAWGIFILKSEKIWFFTYSLVDIIFKACRGVGLEFIKVN